MYKKTFVYCEKCGKKLIERMPNGLWKFVFGKKSGEDNKPPVYMIIHGSLKMKCIRRTCGHWNIFNYFPTNQFVIETENSGKIKKDKITE